MFLQADLSSTGKGWKCWGIIGISQNLSTQPAISPGLLICSAPSGMDGCFFDELAGHSISGNDVNPWNCFWGLHVFG